MANVQVDPRIGKWEEWRMVPPTTTGYITGGVFAAAVVADGIVFVAAIDGTISAFQE